MCAGCELCVSGVCCAVSVCCVLGELVWLCCECVCECVCECDVCELCVSVLWCV